MWETQSFEYNWAYCWSWHLDFLTSAVCAALPSIIWTFIIHCEQNICGLFLTKSRNAHFIGLLFLIWKAEIHTVWRLKVLEVIFQSVMLTAFAVSTSCNAVSPQHEPHTQWLEFAGLSLMMLTCQICVFLWWLIVVQELNITHLVQNLLSMGHVQQKQ